MLEWMAWTWQTAMFFSAVATMLVTMTVLELAWPTRPRRGFLPLVTTRGDRLFIGLLAGAFLHLAWLGWIAAPLWGASVASLVVMALVLGWG